MKVVLLLLTVVAAATAFHVAYEAGSSSVYDLEIESAAAASAVFTAGGGVSDVTQLPATFALSSAVGASRYYQLAAKVIVTARCQLNTTDTMSGQRAWYLSISFSDVATQCPSTQQKMCADIRQNYAVMNQYPIGVIQSESGEITHVDLDDRVPHDIQLLQRSFVNQLSTYLGGSARSLAAVITRRDALDAGVTDRYTYVGGEDAHTVIVDKRREIPESVAMRKGAKASNVVAPAQSEKVEQSEASRLLLTSSVVERVSSLHTLRVSTQPADSSEWKEVITIVTRSDLSLVEAGVATGSIAGESDTNGVWQLQCTADHFSDYTVFLEVSTGVVSASRKQQSKSSTQQHTRTETVKVDADDEQFEFNESDSLAETEAETEVDAEAQAEAEAEAELAADAEYFRNARMVEVLEALNTEQDLQEQLTAAEATVQQMAAEAEADLVAATEAETETETEAQTETETETTTQVVTTKHTRSGLRRRHHTKSKARVYSLSDVSRAAMRARAHGAPDMQDVLAMFQRIQLAFTALEGLDSQVGQIAKSVGDVLNLIDQIELKKDDKAACTVAWSKLYQAMSSEKEAGTNPTGSDGTQGTSEKKTVNSGLLHLLTSAAAAAKAASTSALEKYPTATNLEQVIESIARPIAALLDNSEFPKEARELLGVDDPKSLFSLFRAQVLTEIDAKLAEAKRMVKNPSTGLDAAFDKLAAEWVESGKGLSAATACDAATAPAMLKIMAVIGKVKELISPFKSALTVVGATLEHGRATIKQMSSVTESVNKFLSILLATNFRFEKSFGDEKMLKATVWGEMATRLKEKPVASAGLSLSGGVTVAALGAKRPVVEFNYQPTLKAAAKAKDMFDDSDSSVSILGMKLQSIGLSPEKWIKNLAPKIIKRATDILTDTEPAIQHLVKMFAATLRDPNLFGGAFFRPPMEKIPPPQTKPQHSSSEQGPHTLFLEEFAASGLDAEHQARITGTFQDIPEDPLHLMYFRASKSIITQTDAEGNRIALNEKSLPSIISMLSILTELVDQVAAEASSASLDPELAKAATDAHELVRAMGASILHQLWQGVNVWKPLDTTPSEDIAMFRRFGPQMNYKGKLALEKLMKTFLKLQDALSAKKTGLGPILTVIKSKDVFDHLTGAIKSAGELHDSISNVLGTVGDLATTSRRGKYFKLLSDFGSDLRDAATAFAGLQAALSTSTNNFVKSLGDRLAVQSKAATTLVSFADAANNFVKCAFEAVPKSLEKSVSEADKFWTALDTDRSTADPTATIKAFGEVAKTIEGCIPDYQKVTAFLTETHSSSTVAHIQTGLNVIAKTMSLTASTLTLAGSVGKLPTAMETKDGTKIIEACTATSKIMTTWCSDAKAMLDLAESIDYRPNRLMTAIGTAKLAFETMSRVFTAFSASSVLVDIVARVQPSNSIKDGSSQLVCNGNRLIDEATVGMKTVFEKDFTLVSIQLGPIPVFAVPIVIGLGISAHAHFTFEYGQCKAQSGGTSEYQKSDQIMVVGDLAAKLVGDVSVGVGVPFFSAGVQIAVTFVDVHAPTHLSIDVPNKGVAVWVKPYLEALAGDVKAYVDIGLRFATTLYKWNGVRTYLPNSRLCFQSKKELGVCPPADGWDKPAHMIATGELASPLSRPKNSGRCMACDYISSVGGAGYWKCNLHPKRFAALAGYSGAVTTLPETLLALWGYSPDRVEFFATCDESFQPLTLKEYMKPGESTPRATYSGTYCVRSHVDKKDTVFTYRVNGGSNEKKEAIASVQITDKDHESAKRCADFAARHDSFANGAIPVAGWVYYRNYDQIYRDEVFGVVPHYELTVDATTAVPYISIASKPADPKFTTPLEVSSGVTRTGQCVRCLSTITGDATQAYICPKIGRRTKMYQPYPTVATGILYPVENSMTKKLPRSKLATVMVCDESVNANTKTATSTGYVFVRDPADTTSLTSFIAHKWSCTLGGTWGVSCKTKSLDMASAYDRSVVMLAEKQWETTLRTAKKLAACRPAPLRTHKPTPNFRANGGCFWCNPKEGGFTCAVNAYTSGSVDVELRAKRLGPLEHFNPSEFERVSTLMDKSVYQAWSEYKSAKSLYPRWPVNTDTTVTAIGVCDEYIKSMPDKKRPTMTFVVGTAQTTDTVTEFKTEYTLKITVAGKTWTVQKTWPDLHLFNDRLREQLPGVTLPEFPARGGFLFFGGGEPDAETIKANVAGLEKFFNEAAKLAVVMVNPSFVRFTLLVPNVDPKLIEDETRVGGYVCFSKANVVSACVKYEDSLEHILKGEPAPTRVTDSEESGAGTMNEGKEGHITYFFDKMIADGLANVDSDLSNSRCDQYPPGMLGSDSTHSENDPEQNVE